VFPLSENILCKPPVRSLQQIRRHRQVDLRFGQSIVAKVGSKRRQQFLHIRAALIPRDKAMNGEGVAPIPISE